jgi:hypothetical protein
MSFIALERLGPLSELFSQQTVVAACWQRFG